MLSCRACFSMLFPRPAPILSSPSILIPIPNKPNKLPLLDILTLTCFPCTSHSSSRLFTSWIWKSSLAVRCFFRGNYYRKQMVFSFDFLYSFWFLCVWSYIFMMFRWSPDLDWGLLIINHCFHPASRFSCGNGRFNADLIKWYSHFEDFGRKKVILCALWKYMHKCVFIWFLMVMLIHFIESTKIWSP